HAITKWRSDRDQILESDARTRSCLHVRIHAATGDRNLGAADRKSTRLNSSHLVISYAVFCLKKKKKQQNTHTQHKNNQTNNYPTIPTTITKKTTYNHKIQQQKKINTSYTTH